jgi:hypothetical protein
MELVADNGRLATITGDPPAAERGIQVSHVYLAPDGPVWNASPPISPSAVSRLSLFAVICQGEVCWMTISESAPVAYGLERSVAECRKSVDDLVITNRI